jgi:flagellar basal-body rod protein FlgB
MPLFQMRTDVVVRGALDGLTARHRVYANNLANIETPGFQPGEVSFEADLRRVRDDLERQPAKIGHVALPSLEVVPDDQNAHRADGNGVQADLQAIRLTENTLSYEALTLAARLRGDLLREVVTDGKR